MRELRLKSLTHVHPRWRGNLCPGGAVGKISGKAIVFEREEDALRGILNGKLKAGHVIINRGKGPKGGLGMREMLSPRSAITLGMPAKELETRLRKWKQPKPNYRRGVLAKYAALVNSASEGAVTDVGL